MPYIHFFNKIYTSTCIGEDSSKTEKNPPLFFRQENAWLVPLISKLPDIFVVSIQTDEHKSTLIAINQQLSIYHHKESLLVNETPPPTVIITCHQ